MRRLLHGRWALAATPAMAQAPQRAGSPGQAWGPNGNGTLHVADDRRWTAFAATHVTLDDAKGEYRAAFTPQLQAQDGKPVTITGYMLAVDVSSVSPHFVLTRYATGCPFCPPSGPTEAIEVHAVKGVPLSLDPVTVSGTLRLSARSDTGMFFSLDGASTR